MDGTPLGTLHDRFPVPPVVLDEAGSFTIVTEKLTNPDSDMVSVGF